MSKNKRWILKNSKKTLKIAAFLMLPAIPVKASISYDDVGKLIWQDDFDSLNSEYWTSDDGNGCAVGLCGWGNAELQAYHPDNVFIEAIGENNNALVLQARQEAYDDRNFTSGKINSENKVSVQYGLIEMRIKVPDLEQGLWPAAWMLGTSTLPWPAKGEIDMMEMGHNLASREGWLAYNNDSSDDNGPTPDINNYTGSNMIFYSDDACSDGNPTCAASLAWQNDNAYVSETPMNDRYVIYRTYWTESEMRFTIVDNGVEYDMYDSPFTLGDDLSAFKAPYYLLLNLAVGGNFTDSSVDSDITAPIPASMYIDYIRVYELDGQGSVNIGDQSVAESGTFGVFTDNAETTNKLEVDINSHIYLWDGNSSAGNEPAYEGDNVISWNVNTANVWFGSGIQSIQALDMSNFEEGELTFNIKIPADIDFRIGITDTYSNENWITFPANETVYGLERNGEWGKVTIPVSDIRGTLIALQSLQYPFAISSDPNNLPTSTFNYSIDNVLWTGGGEEEIVVEVEDKDSDGDGVIDTIDLCANTPTGSIVDAVGCAIPTSLISDNGNSSLVATANTELRAASLAFDGDMVTRWESKHGIDPSTLTIDLGGEFYLSEAVIYWEAANAKNYTIEASTDNENWDTITTYDEGTFGSRTDTLALSGLYRYVRMNATSRSEGNFWGYSIYEMEIYGVDSNLTDSSDDVDSDDNTNNDDNIDSGDNTNTDDNIDSGDGTNTDDGMDSDNGNNTDDGIDSGDNNSDDTQNTATITPLFDASTDLEQEISYDRGDALVTRFADRGRDRHAKEDQFQAYDHYISHYWTHRTAQVQFEDYAAKGGNNIVITFITEWKLDATEFRAWYRGVNTVAEYHGNLGGNVIELDSGTYDHDFNKISDDGDQYRYTLTIDEYRSLDGEYGPLEVGQGMEFELSQFLDFAPEGRDNYYGTTYLYIVGKGLVPWKTEGAFEDQNSLRENSYEIAESGWLGGNTTLPYNYSNESENHFMQMATNLSNVNGQAFVLGRRIHHTDFIDGSHDESDENGIFEEMVGLSGTHYVNRSCDGCHQRNGRAAPAELNESLDKWVFKVAQANGQADPNMGYVLQPNNTGIDDAEHGEGTVSIFAWTEENGLRSPNYSFSRYTPDLFSGRISPQLVGLGLLEAIDESTILALEDVNDSDSDGISGKAQRVEDPTTGQIHLGRFGWKAGKISLKHQIAGAFNTDMGVMSSVFPAPDCGKDQTTCGNEGAEIDDEDLNNLVKYVALLGVRAQRDIDDANVQQGKTLFNDIGCDSCHTPTMKTGEFHPYAELRNQTIQPYTDLLLHDMGEGLADNLGEGDANGAEWRTTPLWGLGLSACVTGGTTNPTGSQGDNECAAEHSYLHDGRARTIEEAILWHGGESQPANTAYQNLTDSDKAALLAFLNSL